MMLRRLPHSFALALAVVALFAATASAKRIVRAEVCGADACTTLRGAAMMDIVDGGPPTGPPREAAPFYEARVTVEVEKGHRDTWTTAFVPAYGLVRGSDGTWMDAPIQTEVAFKRAARGIGAAFPASRLGPLGSAPAARVVEVVRPPADPAPVDDDDATWVIAAVGLAALVSVWALVRFARRRAGRSSPAAPTPPGA
jgi:hypothetical protein